MAHSLYTLRQRLELRHQVSTLCTFSASTPTQHVGDVMAPLLGYVDIHGMPGDRISHTCNPPIYLPVHKSYIDATHVRITDEHGQNVMFPDNIANVVLRLHFRKAKGVSLF